MEDNSSQLWRGVVNCTYTGRFIAEKVVRGVDYSACSEQLSEWFRGLDLGGGDWTLTAHRLVSRPPEVLLASRPRPLEPEHKHLEQPARLWPVEAPTGAPEPRSVPVERRYR